MDSSGDKNILCKDSVDPDPELLVWEKWIRIRKEETEHLARKTGRAPAELEMNIAENIREKRERKTVLEHSQIEKKVGVRKTIWEQPQRLKQKDYRDPVYEIKRTRAELGRPRIVEHIGVPKVIQETEKGITGVSKRKPCTNLDLSYIAYRDKREKELEENIKKIDPFRPETQELMIIGKKPKVRQQSMPPIPNITVSSITAASKDVSSTYAVRINDTIFVKDASEKFCHAIFVENELGHNKCESWSYYFNCPINKVGRSNFFLENIGTATLRYCWKKIKLAYEDTQDQVFFFNKNENVIFPGQKQNISITFVSHGPGSHSESWEILFLNVHFFETQNRQLTLNLYADSVENMSKIKKKIHKLENIIYNNVLKNIARDLLEEMFVKATSIEPQIYSYKKMFLEAEMFVMKNPVCFYHQTEVAKLKDIFTEMSPQKPWDLSISSWRQAMIEKEFDDRMKYFELLRISHRECLKPWYEDDDLLTRKYKAVKQILGQMADKFDEEYSQLSRIYNPNEETESGEPAQQEIETNSSPSLLVKNMFYLKAYEHLENTMELCAGILSSLDLNRWVLFDFCRS